MRRITSALPALLLVMTHPAAAQDKIWETDDVITRRVESVNLRMERDRRPGAEPQRFMMRADSGYPHAVGVFQGVCTESLSVEMTARITNFDMSAYRASGSGSDLPIIDALNAMTEALVEQCDQLQVVRVRFKPLMHPGDEYDYQGTLTRADNWRLQDGYVATTHDGSHRFVLTYRDTTSIGGVYHEGSCEADPLLLLEPTNVSGAERARGETLNFHQFAELAGKVSAHYSEECPQTTRIRYILKPQPRKYRCANGNECLLVGEKNPQSGEWKVDQSQFEWVDPKGPISDANDMTEVLAAGEFRIIRDYQKFFAFYYQTFISVYGDSCRAHIQDPVGRVARDVLRYLASDGTVQHEEELVRNYVLERKYAPGFHRLHDTWVNWAASQGVVNLFTGPHITGNPAHRATDSFAFLTRSVRQLQQAISGQCMNERIQTVYQNMYNYAHHEPAIKGKYTTDKEPVYVPAGSSAPVKTKAMLDQRRAVGYYSRQPPPSQVRREADAPPQAQQARPTALSGTSDTLPVAAPAPDDTDTGKSAVEPRRRGQAPEQLAKQRTINKEIRALRRQHNEEMVAASRAHQQALRNTRVKEERRALKQAHRAERDRMTAELQRKIAQLQEGQDSAP